MGIRKEWLSIYLNVFREQVANYETGKRRIQTYSLTALANLFCMDEYDFYEEEDIANKNVSIAFPIIADKFNPVDLSSIADLKSLSIII